MSGLFGSSKGTVQTQSSNAPWSGVQPYLSDLYGQARNLYYGGNAPALGGNAPAMPSFGGGGGFASNLLGKLSGQLGSVFNPGAQTGQGGGQGGYSGPLLAGDATAQLGSTIRGENLNPASNPFLGQYVNDALGLVKSNFAGQYGGQAGGNLGNSGYQEMLTRTLANTALPIYADQYSRERQNQLQASQIAPEIDKANMLNPWAPLQAYQGVLGAGSPFTQGTNEQPYYQNNTANTLGTLGTVASMAAPFFLGFSDARLKENIERIGTHDSGIGLYKYNMKGDPKPQIGVLAQELEQVKPEAVHEIAGYKAVDFRMI